ncbi:KilA-N domain-containing protein, partial [Mycobacterium tuberculosis]|nr:KilA-N domain-containing protein [Mycobacterium tuberculosis]
FTIAETVINMVDGLYSLNDLHKASGNIEKHRPAFFIRNQEVTELAEEIMQCANLHSDQVIRKVNGGHNRGTYACKEIVYRYAMWISPKFALIVIRAFDAMVTRTDSTQRAVLVAACTKLSAGNMA